LSMGGGHTVSVTLSNPTMFGYIGVFSGAVGNTEDERYNALTAAKPKLYYVACGASDSLVTSNRALVKVLQDKGINNKYFESTGAHAWYNWRIYLTDFAPLLFK
jgi:enterochelin esterase-like enzyme